MCILKECSSIGILPYNAVLIIGGKRFDMFGMSNTAIDIRTSVLRMVRL